jgi:hypothetical protein
VTLDDWSLVESNGGDITIGGAAGDPASNSLSNSISALILGTSNAENVVRVLAGTGKITMRGEATEADNADSGIRLKAGVKLIGGTVELYGKNKATSTSNNSSAGIFFYEDSTTARTLIEATDSSPDQNKIETVSLVGEIVAGDFGVMFGNTTTVGSVADQITIRATGNLAGIVIDGTSGKSSGVGVWMAGAVVSTANGDVLIDGELVGEEEALDPGEGVLLALAETLVDGDGEDGVSLWLQQALSLGEVILHEPSYTGVGQHVLLSQTPSLTQYGAN